MLSVVCHECVPPLMSLRALANCLQNESYCIHLQQVPLQVHWSRSLKHLCQQAGFVACPWFISGRVHHRGTCSWGSCDENLLRMDMGTSAWSLCCSSLDLLLGTISISGSSTVTVSTCLNSSRLWCDGVSSSCGVSSSDVSSISWGDSSPSAIGLSGSVASMNPVLHPGAMSSLPWSLRCWYAKASAALTDLKRSNAKHNPIPWTTIPALLLRNLWYDLPPSIQTDLSWNKLSHLGYIPRELGLLFSSFSLMNTLRADSRIDICFPNSWLSSWAFCNAPRSMPSFVILVVSPGGFPNTHCIGVNPRTLLWEFFVYKTSARIILTMSSPEALSSWITRWIIPFKIAPCLPVLPHCSRDSTPMVRNCTPGAVRPRTKSPLLCNPLSVMTSSGNPMYCVHLSLNIWKHSLELTCPPFVLTMAAWW